jgi:hypothetical protein
MISKTHRKRYAVHAGAVAEDWHSSQTTATKLRGMATGLLMLSAMLKSTTDMQVLTEFMAAYASKRFWSSEQDLYTIVAAAVPSSRA